MQCSANPHKSNIFLDILSVISMLTFLSRYSSVVNLVSDLFGSFKCEVSF